MHTLLFLFCCLWQCGRAWRRLHFPFQTCPEAVSAPSSSRLCDYVREILPDLPILARIGVLRTSTLNHHEILVVGTSPSAPLCAAACAAKMSSEQQSNKPHRKTDKSDKKASKHEKGHNPKAFISQSGAKASRLARQKVEKDQKRLHVPAIDRTFGGYGAGPSNSKSSTLGNANVKDEGPPPVIVAVVGPPGVRMLGSGTEILLIVFCCAPTGWEDHPSPKSDQTLYENYNDRHTGTGHRGNWQSTSFDSHRMSKRSWSHGGRLQSGRSSPADDRWKFRSGDGASKHICMLT